jgi:hypothetical protein
MKNYLCKETMLFALPVKGYVNKISRFLSNTPIQEINFRK